MRDVSATRTGPPESSGAHRLFFAIWPDDATRAGIGAVAAELRPHSPDGRWVAPDRYHLTLEFLGTHRGFPAALAEAACAAAADVRSGDFTIHLDRHGSFRSRRSHLWWFGCGYSDPLLRLREALTSSLAAQGVPVASGPFVPHVTLVRGALRPPPANVEVPIVVWSISQFVLIHSESGHRDAYQLVGRWPLRMP